MPTSEPPIWHDDNTFGPEEGFYGSNLPLPLMGSTGPPTPEIFRTCDLYTSAVVATKGEVLGAFVGDMPSTADLLLFSTEMGAHFEC